MNRTLKRIVIGVVVLFMVAYTLNRTWRVKGERRSHGILEHIFEK